MNIHTLTDKMPCMQKHWGSLALLLVCSTGCTVQQHNGNDINFEQPSILNHQQWQIGQQNTAPNGDRNCTISSGELEVTLHLHDRKVLQRVATANTLDPGEYYDVIIDGQTYETDQGWFTPKTSSIIVNAMMKSDKIYTETKRINLKYGHATPQLRNVDNVISMEGFASVYKACEHFVKNK